MAMIRSSNSFLLSLFNRVGLKGETRTAEQLKEHYEIEKKLASQLRASSSEERRSLYAALYDEYNRLIPGQQSAAADISKTASPEFRFLRRFLRKDATFLEIGSGDCTLSLAVAPWVKQIYALEVSEEIVRSVTGPRNFELLLFDGYNVPLPPECVDMAYSHQVMEHLHPDDALEQLTSIYKALKSQGIYLCVTPNRLSGPHDISMYFDLVATGFHLKEYTNTDLSDLFKRVGFSQVKVYAGALGLYMRCPLAWLKVLERLLDTLPRKQSQKLARLALLINIRVVGVKK